MDAQTELDVNVSMPIHLRKPSLLQRLVGLLPRRPEISSINPIDELVQRSQRAQPQPVERVKKDEIEQFRKDILQEIDQRSRLIEETGICPILTHFTPTENFISMLDKANDTEFGIDALRIRIHAINEQLGISPKSGWGSDRGRVSFYVSGMDRQIVKKNDVLVVETVSSEVNSAATMNEQGETVIYALPWFAVMGEDFTSISRADAGELQLDLDPTGNRDVLVKRGVSLVHPLVQIFVPKIHEEKFRNAVASLHDPDLQKQLLRQLHFVSPKEAHEISLKIRSDAYTETLVGNIAERHDLKPESIYSQAAVYSMITPLNLKWDTVKYTNFSELKEHAKKFGLKWVLEYAIRTSKNRLLPLLLKQASRQLRIENNLLPSSEDLVNTLFARIKSYS